MQFICICYFIQAEVIYNRLLNISEHKPQTDTPEFQTKSTTAFWTLYHGSTTVFFEIPVNNPMVYEYDN